MFQNQLISAVVDWEKRLEIEDEKRKNQRHEPYVNYLARVEYPRKERTPIFARIFNSRKERQPAYRYYTQEPCQET